MRSRQAFVIGLAATALSCGGGSLSGTGSGGNGGGGTTGVVGGSGGAAGTPSGSGDYVLTEWKLPFPESHPFQIAAQGDHVFYLTWDVEERVGRLDVTTGVVAEWTTPYTSTSPGDIKVRSDGVVFIAALSLGEIGQFEPGTQVLTRWKLPPSDPTTPAGGPFNLALDGGTGVFFTVDDQIGGYVGRLDTATGELRSWSVTGAAGASVVVAPDGAVLLSSWPGFGPYRIVRLDPSTGVATGWPLSIQPFYPIVADPSGSVFFEELSSDFLGLARLVPSTGVLTEWRAPGYPTDSLALLSGRVYFGLDGDAGLYALDPTVPGESRTIAPVVSPAVLPFVSHLTPTQVALAGDQLTGVMSQRRIASETSGAFESWPIQQPRMNASIPNAVYFEEDDSAMIARLMRY